ncbi:diacylglycerol kinase [Psychromonas sp. CNPT3]|uniref:diacylglycerol kinase n=1 Tax=Psychromonas sp. CNPT3 TaxID=314282 RepID=UPI00006E584F|nr:diacylglycerol kinase [Psychromonas sp. CNPT3]AGH81941.1 diacylglycerol kinase [Psychromonas sp. CNPT3]
MKPGMTGLKRIIFATKYSLQGLKAAWIHEAAFRQELSLLVVLSTLTFWLPVNTLEQLALIACLFLVLIMELVNSAIEAVVDRIGAEIHELSGRAKDIGSAGVFVALVLTVITWAMILLPKI